ncbi:hypothetical protein [Pararcticibacter amylolyticus]|uniref:Uncharacterized protein n=1 Tax=Pararcticibacter amylolyticus TaxID=2173175 RepID=A0A2U2PFR9_9SPHI|nr:hypothetical protein [Pararcticibacter amylolyticus]PWG80210.1 hypothetical protein DDR33_13535 [Pararcticibacter amylolyticus]
MNEGQNAKSYYAYIFGNPCDPMSYYKTSIKPEFGVGNILCAIYATGAGTHPDKFSEELEGYIADALMSGISQPQTGETVVFMRY